MRHAVLFALVSASVSAIYPALASATLTVTRDLGNFDRGMLRVTGTTLGAPHQLDSYSVIRPYLPDERWGPEVILSLTLQREVDINITTTDTDGADGIDNDFFRLNSLNVLTDNGLRVGDSSFWSSGAGRLYLGRQGPGTIYLAVAAYNNNGVPATGAFDFTLDLTTFGPEKTPFSGDTTGKPVFTPPDYINIPSLSSSPYDVVPFYVTASGFYSFETTPLDLTYNGRLALYADSFDPANPLTNLINLDTDAKNAGVVNPVSFIQSATLDAGRQYYLVQTGEGPTDFGAYTGVITGGFQPAQTAVIGLIPEPSSALALTTLTLAQLQRRRTRPIA